MFKSEILRESESFKSWKRTANLHLAKAKPNITIQQVSSFTSLPSLKSKMSESVSPLSSAYADAINNLEALREKVRNYSTLWDPT